MRRHLARAALTVIAGFLVGVGGISVRDARAQADLLDQLTRFNKILTLVKHNYVDTLNAEELIDGAIRGMLEDLDPHTNYLKPNQNERMEELNSGEYSGIGISFEIIEGVLTVISPIEGSPSWDLGIKPGDRIVEIEGESAIGIEQTEVFEKLRGPQGTVVHVGIERAGVDSLIPVAITRATVAIKSVSQYFMMEPGTGYIRANRFSRHTSEELEEALTALEDQGMERLLLDLRGNTGGYLNQAIEVADKFIEGGKLIVYTKGRISGSSEEYFSTDRASHPRYPIVVLIDHGSASASEIVSGAIQDWDRGLIVGTTSFGKGLVQRQFPLKDGGSLLLTVAKYYTPSGRLIQRDYEGKDRTTYIVESHAGREEAASDSALAERPVYSTASGRPVYGGGGITPDVWVEPKVEYNDVQKELLSRDRHTFFNFANELVGERHPDFGEFAEFLREWHMSDALFEDFKAHVLKSTNKVTAADLDAEREFIEQGLRVEIAGNVWGPSERYHTAIAGDPAVQEALGLFPQAELLAKGDIAKYLEVNAAYNAHPEGMAAAGK